MPIIRSFIALPTSTEIQKRIASVQSELRQTEADVKWDSQDKFHITLKFLGDMERSKLDQFSDVLENGIQAFNQFDIIFETVGAFPHPKNPRIVWIGIQPSQLLLDLQIKVEQWATESGFPQEEHRFHPHITLGRVKGTRNIVRLTEATKTCTFEPLNTQCPEFLLIQSTLRPGGSIYTILTSFPLRPEGIQTGEIHGRQ